MTNTQLQFSQAHHIQALINNMNLLIRCTSVAGRVSHFLPNWEVLTQDQWVLHTVAGHQLDLTSPPRQAHVPQQIQTTTENATLITVEVAELLSKGAIVETQLSPNSYVSQIFLVEKKGGGQRPVINLKGLNQFVVQEHFKMEGLHLLPDLLQPGDWMVKLDLKDAYLQIPIHPSHQHLLTFLWEGKGYRFTCLPFSLSSAPRVFTKLMKPVVGFLRQVGCRLIIYLDDLLVVHQDKLQLQQIIPLICKFFECLGLLVNHKKSILDPFQQMEFLGFEIHSQPMTLSIPQEKMRKIQQDACRLMTKPSVSVRELAQFVGKATATMRALPSAPLHYRALQFLMNSVHSEDQVQETLANKFNTVVQLDLMSKSDLLWWISLDRDSLSTPIVLPPPSVSIESDASNKGWGAVLNSQTRTGGIWSMQEQEHHINYLELLAAFLALQAFGKTWANMVVLCRLDNVTAVTYINQKGGTASKLLCQLAITIWNWCVARNISLMAEHLPGHLNTIADQESRSVQDRCDWMLNPDIFQRIQELTGPLEVDLFASRLTRQLPQFFSWRPDPEATATDAFLQDWSQQRGYANPPWCLIHRCLSKVRRELARVVLITPFWNTQSCFPIVLELLENYPLILPSRPDLVVMPTGQEFLMKQGVPQLIAWPISGNPIYHKDFLQRLQALCLPHGETRPTQTTAPLLLNGLVGVTNGVEIPFQAL